jgi:hypothetical protein
MVCQIRAGVVDWRANQVFYVLLFRYFHRSTLHDLVRLRKS